jgi:transposase
LADNEHKRQPDRGNRSSTVPIPGRLTSIADVNGEAVASYIGMIPCEHSSGKRQRLGKLTKQGNTLLRYLWTEATKHAVQKDPELKRFYRASSSKKEWARQGLRPRANWAFDCGS